MGGYREGVQTLTGPSAKWLWKEQATEAGLGFLRDTRVGCINIGGKSLEEGCDGIDRVTRGKMVGRAPHKCDLSCFLLRRGGQEDRLFLSFVGRLMGARSRITPLGSIISVGDRTWPCKKPTAVVQAAR